MNEEEKKVFLLLSLLQEIENSPSDFNPGEEEEEDENHVQRECDRIIRSLKMDWMDFGEKICILAGIKKGRYGSSPAVCLGKIFYEKPRRG